MADYKKEKSCAKKEKCLRLWGLKMAFESPVYALTLGSSDSLAKIIALQIKTEPILCDKIQNCLIEGNILKEVLEQPKGLEFSLKDGAYPLNYHLPVAFSYQSDYGMRKVIRRKEFSFIGPSIYVKGLQRKGIGYKGWQIPIFSLND